MKTWQQITQEQLKKEPKEKREFIKKYSGVEIWKHIYYLADIRKFPDESLLGRLFHLDDFACIGWNEKFTFELIYKKNGKSAISKITDVAYRCCSDFNKLLDLDIKCLKDDFKRMYNKKGGVNEFKTIKRRNKKINERKSKY